MLILCLLPFSAKGQQIVHVMGDTTVCVQDSVMVGMGFNPNHEVVVRNVETALSHGETAFLPDGVECGTMGCSYRSSVTFSGFGAGDAIQSVNDIKYIRLNLEHSFVGDLYINVTCPNGQKADILRFSNYNGGAALSDCLTGLPASSRGWNTPTYSNTDHTTFGIANSDDYSIDPCEHSGYLNAPGYGWNYCWSNNTNSGYTYASDGGYIYRTANQIYAPGASTYCNYRVDSSNVAAGTNFYHPDQSFSSLVGCPLNGEWYIEVIDGVRQDNGYIFNWELVLNDALVPQDSMVTGYGLAGDSVSRIDDSTFAVYRPSGSTSDTTITYHATIYGTGGATLDTVLRVRFVPQLYHLVDGQYCEGDTLVVDELRITQTTHRIDTVMLAGIPCPVVREVDVTFHPSYDLYDTLGICSNQRFVYNGVDYGGPGDFLVHSLTANGCDSNTHLTLVAVDAQFNAMPYLSEDDERWSRDTILAGCAPFTIYLSDSTGKEADRRWHTGDTGWYSSEHLAHTYDSAGVYTITLAATSINGCRDTAVLRNMVMVFDRPEPDFWWEPESPVMSHPRVELFAVEGEGLLGYTWAVQRGDGSGCDSLYGPSANYSWSTDDDLVSGDMSVTLIEVLHHTGPYGLPVDCYDSVEKTITIVNDWLQFPNLVTPNGDGINDIWKVVNLLECGMYSMNELWVYSAWGSLVYHAKNITKEEEFWDPEETNSPDGTYYFRFSARSLYGIVKRNGTIEVVR
ncbi:MAG: gliding motility-associated C-terminal domain-containing protein [Bacteroidales bacterium]|nr:gliding motility-associated C-terminal domain-containing protein [Bacteroidales bacterium]